MTASFIAASLSVMSSNYIYQLFCLNPDWAVATERTWFQGAALLAVGAALAIRSIRS